MAIIVEASKDEVVGLRRCAEDHKMSGSDEEIKEMVWWIRSERFFKRRVTKSVNQYMKNMTN